MLERFVALAPNPVKDQLELSLPSHFNQVEMRVYNLLGQPITQMNLTAGQSTVDVSHWAKGVYLVEVKLPGGRIQSFKLIKV